MGVQTEIVIQDQEEIGLGPYSCKAVTITSTATIISYQLHSSRSCWSSAIMHVKPCIKTSKDFPTDERKGKRQQVIMQVHQISFICFACSGLPHELVYHHLDIPSVFYNCTKLENYYFVHVTQRVLKLNQ